MRDAASSSVTGRPYSIASGMPGEPLPLPTSTTSSGSGSPISGRARSASSTSSRMIAASSGNAVTESGASATSRQ